MEKKYNRRVLVTGGMGFIGSNYLNSVVPKRTRDLFINVDALTYAADVRNITVDTRSNYIFEKADITDHAQMAQIFEKHKPTHIVHFAAETHVDQSIADPSLCVRTNVDGTNALLQLSRDAGIKLFHLVSTDEVYGELTIDAPSTKENAPYRPRNPYSASKAAAELLTLSYYWTYGLPVVITRSSNNYGPNQDRTKLIPKFISLLLEGKKVPLYATGSNIRDWIYVEDNVLAIDLVFTRGKVGEIYNIGGEEELTNLDVTKTILKHLNKTESEIEFVADRAGHDFRYSLSNEKIRQELKWKQKTKFSNGILKTIAFYKKRYKMKHGVR
jgi:dTDP-glucose 4,6-dehydratase